MQLFAGIRLAVMMFLQFALFFRDPGRTRAGAATLPPAP